MELRIKPHIKNNYPLGAICIKTDDVSVWVKEIQRMGFSLDMTQVYPIPNIRPNTIWGCMILLGNHKVIDLGKNIYLQCVNGNVYIPENALLFPTISTEELTKLFPTHIYVFHPEFGLVELAEPVLWESLVGQPILKNTQVTSPSKPIFIPSEIRSFQIKPISPENVLEEMAAKAFPTHKNITDDSLSVWEKMKLYSLRSLFDRKKNGDGSHTIAKTGLLNAFEKIRGLFSKNTHKGIEELQERFEDLENRNQKAIDRLLEMFKKNPDEALKYAIPLDGDGITRGGERGGFNLSKRWFDFSLFGGSGGGNSGSVVMENDQFMQLNKQYRETAEELKRKKEFQKAAFIYIKLLKDYYGAGQAMEEGKLYQEAAAIHIKLTKDKTRAADCYEKGSMYNEAIDIYKELGSNEKVGDIYSTIGQKKEANVYYGKVAEGYTNNYQYVKASLIYRNKMGNAELGQSILMDGWRTNRDAYKCLNNYFNNIDDSKQLGQAINHVYNNEMAEHKRVDFLNVIKTEYQKKNGLEEPIRDIAYEIIAEELKKDAGFASELRHFNQKDNELTKDTMRYQQKRRK